MNTLVRDFYRTKGVKETLFHEILFLTENSVSWEETTRKCPSLPRGWFELSRLPAEDRIEFVRDFWINLLPYHPTFHPFIEEFFERIDDIAIVLIQQKPDELWSVEIVYSLKDDRSFFRGLPACDELEIDELKSLIGVSLPRDYLAFLRIHNGFGKLSDLGIMKVDAVINAKQRVANQFLITERSLKIGNQIIDPNTLIPFYESCGQGSYQCFYTEWYPGSEMGNVYLSLIDYTISDYTDRKGWTDQLAFPSFLDWLAFYLEGNSVD